MGDQETALCLELHQAFGDHAGQGLADGGGASAVALAEGLDAQALARSKHAPDDVAPQLRECPQRQVGYRVLGGVGLDGGHERSARWLATACSAAS
jgi:hypothetical protein